MTAGKLKSRGVLLILCYVAFVSLGLPDALVGVAWPSIRRSFHLEQKDISWIFLGAGCSYFVSSFLAGRLLRFFNLGVLLAASSALVASSGLDYSLARVWPLFALGSIFHGLGSGAIDAGLNHFVACHFSARHMNWLHACYSLGAMLGPMLMTAVISANRSWRLGYFIVAVTLFLLSLLFIKTESEWDDPTEATTPSERDQAAEHVPMARALRNRIVWLQMLLFFIYTGLEVSLGQWSFTVLTESRDIKGKVAGIWVTVYWASILAGRIVFGFIVDRVGIDGLIRSSIVTAVTGTALFAWNPAPRMTPFALALAGLGLAVIFPCLMSRTPQRLGKQLAAHAIGFQVGAAMLGSAAMPSSIGLIAQYAGLSMAATAIFVMAVALFVLHEAVVFLTSAKKNYTGVQGESNHFRA